jgi:predicted Zn-dependent protease
MSAERLRERLERQAAGQWELYRKAGRSRERVTSARSSGQFARREEGWAARWFEKGALRFACASDSMALERAFADAVRVTQAPSVTLDWPTGQSAEASDNEVLEPPPDLFQELARLLAAESRGQALLTQLTIRRGWTLERIENARGLSVAIPTRRLDGFAHAVGRRGAHACETRVLFRWEAEPDLVSVARRLCDGTILPLSGKSTPVNRGEWLLEPAVAAFVLAALAPLFTLPRLPHWIQRRHFCAESVTIVDDASADASFDGEGTPTRRVTLVERGRLRERLRDLEAAAEGGGQPTGHGVRPSYRTRPVAAPRRLFLETKDAVAPLELLSSVRRGLFASSLTAPVWVDLEADRYQVEFTGVAIVGGRAQGPVAGARARGRLSRLLTEIAGSATDRQFLPVPYPAGTPTLLIGRAQFD